MSINNRTTQKDFTVNSVYFRVLLLGCLLGIVAYHLHNFYVSVWHDKALALFWTISHSGLAVYLMLKNNAWDTPKGSGAITIYTIALTYILHTNLFQIDKYTFAGANILLMKTLIIGIVLAGIAGLATTFKK